ncbi:GbpC/Spa domain-containing protein [Streptococcus acidominimus]|uniref:Putative glucan-binding protein C n=1 Tax=Streptococcus acidominimus TaxID=1326 RepID=A0A1Q8EFW1_STRAI|nr:GbpC/Spa domain-containing protein [Streptococcus acidominimus]OLF50701.1 hypothetical protein BU200_00505 [Streptococcus acidominimus]SUN07576.1 putative glucan-binding protein C [Streptococcus acidominimus]
MKKNAYYLSIGIALYSLSLLARPTEVWAETPTSPTPEASTPPNTITVKNTEHQQAIQDAQKAGVEVIEFGYKQAPSKEAAEKMAQDQADYIRTTTKEYLAASKTYQNEAPHYQQYLKEQEKFQDASLEYAQYEEQENHYQSELARYQEQENNYQKELEKYEEDQAANLSLQEEFENSQKQYEKDQATYQEKLRHYEAAKKEADLAVADYQRKVENYQVEKMRYETAKKAYDAEVAEAEKLTQTDGYLSQVSAQYLISRSEPNATVRFEGVTKFIGSSHQFGNALSGIGGSVSELPISHTPILSRGAGAATAAKAGDGYGLILEKGKPITVIYSGLEQTSYDGQKIAQLVYTYELTSTFASDQSATAFIYTDPTKTIYTGTSGQNKGLVDFTIRQTMSYYLENGKKVQFREDAPALLSFASRNNTFEFGEQEYVRLHKGMTFIPISGSSVTGEDGYVAARGSNNSIKDGSRFNRGDWDSDGHPNEYYGAGVARVIGDTISFDFGIRYSQENINRSSQPLHLRSGSRQWFTVNADIKAKGIINARPGNPPVMPHEPNLPALPLKPIAPVKPIAPTYRSLTRPIAPVKPVRKHRVIPHKPRPPKEVEQPKFPNIPIIFIQRIVYPTIKINYARQYRPPVSQANGIQATPAPSNNTIATRNYSLPLTLEQASSTIIYPSPSLYPPALTRQNPHPVTPPALPTPASPTIKKSPIPHGSPALMEKELRDYWFSKNTGISGDDKELFFRFIDELEKEGRAKYGNDLAKINQHIANGIAYKVYGVGGLQPKVADVGEKPKNNDALDLIENIHKLDRFKIDFPHLAAPIATASQSGLKKEVLKGLLGLNAGMFFGVMPGDVFFQANSWLGDTLTTMNEKDKITDKDAFIIHTLYLNKPLNEAIKHYYSISDLDKKREDLYQLALKVKYPKSPNPELLLKVSSIISYSTIGLVAVFHILAPIKQKWKELESWWNDFKDNNWKGIKSGWNDFSDKLKEYWEKFTSFFSKDQGSQKSAGKAQDKQLNPSLTTSKQGQAKTGSLFSKMAQAIKPVSKVLHKTIIQPAKNIFKTVGNIFQKKVVQPFKQFLKPVTKPLHKTIVQPARNIFKTVGNIFQKKVVQPFKQFLKPVTKPLHKTIVQPARNIFKTVGNIFQKKVVRPFKQVSKPVTKALQKKIIQPMKKAGKSIQKKVIQPIRQATKPVAKTIQKRVLQPIQRIAKRVTAPIQRKVIRPVRQENRPARKPKAPKPIQRAKAPQRRGRKPAKKKGR